MSQLGNIQSASVLKIAFHKKLILLNNYFVLFTKKFFKIDF